MKLLLGYSRNSPSSFIESQGHEITTVVSVSRWSLNGVPYDEDDLLHRVPDDRNLRTPRTRGSLCTRLNRATKSTSVSFDIVVVPYYRTLPKAPSAAYPPRKRSQHHDHDGSVSKWRYSFAIPSRAMAAQVLPQATRTSSWRALSVLRDAMRRQLVWSMS